MKPEDKAKVQQALEALEVVWREHKAIDGLRQLLEAEPVQSAERGEPDAWISGSEKERLEMLGSATVYASEAMLDDATALYTTPPAQPASQRSKNKAWVDLTDEDIAEVGGVNIDELHLLPYSFARAIGAKLREKNGGAA
jgi:hypothetical protein